MAGGDSVNDNVSSTTCHEDDAAARLIDEEKVKKAIRFAKAASSRVHCSAFTNAYKIDRQNEEDLAEMELACTHVTEVLPKVKEYIAECNHSEDTSTGNLHEQHIFDV